MSTNYTLTGDQMNALVQAGQEGWRLSVIQGQEETGGLIADFRKPLDPEVLVREAFRYLGRTT